MKEVYNHTKDIMENIQPKLSRLTSTYSRGTIVLIQKINIPFNSFCTTK